MFVFYYSVLSEVTPPTALAAVGASAITGGKTIPTMWQALKYALPAFLVPIAFVLTADGESLLARDSFVDIVWTTVVACIAIAGIAVAAGGWIFGIGAAPTISRVLAGTGGVAAERAVDVQINRLRRKIERDPREPRYLQTVRGAGYMLVPD